ncbi:MAG: branched-chain amino acid ABC transporter permease [Gaiellaceae bacterium]
MKPRTLAIAAVLTVVLALVPKLHVDIPVIFNGPLDSPGTLQLLALCLVFAGVALTYDLLFGFTGLLSFGHALYFAMGVYLADIAMTKWGWSFWTAVVFVCVATLVVATILGAVSLRVGGIAFAMVTLAFAQAGAVLVNKNPHELTGGEEGLGLDYTREPAAFVGIFNTKNLYWLSLGFAVFVFLVVMWAVESSPGRVWQAIRENELRVSVLGLHTHPYKLISFVLGSFLCAIGGIVYLLLQGGASPGVTTANFTLTLLLMVVIGGAGTTWGALIGGALYTLLDQRLGALGDSSRVQGLPKLLRVPLSEPLFLLGVLFILVVFLLPGGIAGVGKRFSGLRKLDAEETLSVPPVEPA